MKTDNLDFVLELDLCGELVELETAPVDLDPIVMDVPDIEIPDGWDLLPGGVERTIGVNQPFIREQMGRPWQIEVDGAAVAKVTEFRALGEVRSVVAQTARQVYNCGVYSHEPVRSARIATDGPILVRY